MESLHCVYECLLRNGVQLGAVAGVFAVMAILKKLGLLYRMFNKVEVDSTRHGGELVADVLKAHGVKGVFTLVGGHISPILVACEKLGIRVIDTRHEASAVFAADAVARLSGTVGVAAVTAGPGLTNTVTAVKNAQMAESPLLLIGGAAATLLKGRGALQDIDQMSLFKPLCKYCVSITAIRDIVPTLKKAMQVAQSGTPGPVFVEFPIDVLYPYDVVKQEIGGAGGSGKGLIGKIVAWYLNNYMSNLHCGAWEPRDVSPLPVDIPIATPSDVQKCAEMISRAKKPVIVIGSQATLPPTPADNLGQALNELGVPCFLGGMSRGLLGKDSPIQMRQKRKEALREADVIILAGAVCDFRLGYGRTLSKRAKIIAVNRDKSQLYKNTDMFWKPMVALQVDAGSFLISVAERLRGHKVDPEWVSLLQKRDSDKEIENKKQSEVMPDQHLSPMKVLFTLEDIMEDNTILVADGGDFVATAAYILRPRGPLRWLDPGAFGTLGVGGGFALGAKLCRPDCDVWIIYGDGSLGYSVAEYDTFTRHKLPVISLVGNDACWSQIARDQVPRFKSSVACDLAFCAYEQVAEGYGGKGVVLDRSKNDQIAAVLNEAIKSSREGSSVLINCFIGKSSFREGSISV